MIDQIVAHFYHIFVFRYFLIVSERDDNMYYKDKNFVTNELWVLVSFLRHLVVYDKDHEN